jgi:hypothetical protein
MPAMNRQISAISIPPNDALRRSGGTCSRKAEIDLELPDPGMA